MKIRFNDASQRSWRRCGRVCGARMAIAPCRLQRTPENICMCQEFRDRIADPNFEGYCHCRLYYKEKITEKPPLLRRLSSV